MATIATIEGVTFEIKHSTMFLSHPDDRGVVVALPLRDTNLMLIGTVARRLLDKMGSDEIEALAPMCLGTLADLIGEVAEVLADQLWAYQLRKRGTDV